jgi:hypothetical protein
MALYDDPNVRENQSEIVTALRRIVECHESGKVEVVTSREVVGELVNHLLDARKCDKARQALDLMGKLKPQHLPRTPADCGKAICGEARCGVGPKFRDLPRDEEDREVMEYMTENGVDFYVSLDFEHILKEGMKENLESRLEAERSRIVTPQQLIAELCPDS